MEREGITQVFTGECHKIRVSMLRNYAHGEEVRRNTL